MTSAVLGREINLLDRYPRITRSVVERSVDSEQQQEFRRIARQFGREYFDADRTTGYGGYRYDGRWVPIAERFRDHYGLQSGHRVLDVGCAKGFLMHDLQSVVPGIDVVGVELSQYALTHAMDDVRDRVVCGTAQHLPFDDRAFDLVISINTLHNLERPACIEALREIERVSRRHKYVQVDSWLNDQQRDKFLKWVLTAMTYDTPDGWRQLFREADYSGDYYWTITE